MIDLFSRVRYLTPLLATAMLACSPPATGTNASKTTAQTTVKSSDPAIWAVSDEDTTIYLFGSVHMLKPGIVWFDDEVKAAFDRSDELVMEIVKEDPQKMAQIIGKLGFNTNGPPTSSLLSEKVRPRYFAALKQYDLPAQALDRMDPWLVAINLTNMPMMKLGYRDDLGVEKILEDAATASGKKISGLETTEQQLGFFDSLPAKVQVEYLSSTIDDLPNAEQDFGKMLAAWQRGDATDLAKQMNESIKETPEMAKVLLYDRNARWAKWIEQRMKQPGTIFIAVGAGHLSGDRSVVDLLGKDKLTVRRLSKKDFSLE